MKYSCTLVSPENAMSGILLSLWEGNSRSEPWLYMLQDSLTYSEYTPEEGVKMRKIWC